MVNAETLFASLDGMTLSYRELRKRVSELLSSVEADIPAEIGTKELLGIAQEKGWIHKSGPSGQYVIDVKRKKVA